MGYQMLTPQMNVKLINKFQGFNYAYNVLGQFLVLGKNEDLMVMWLKDKVGANSKQASDCAKCLKEWCDAFL